MNRLKIKTVDTTELTNSIRKIADVDIAPIRKSFANLHESVDALLAAYKKTCGQINSKNNI